MRGVTRNSEFELISFHHFKFYALLSFRISPFRSALTFNTLNMNSGENYQTVRSCIDASDMSIWSSNGLWDTCDYEEGGAPVWIQYSSLKKRGGLSLMPYSRKKRLNKDFLVHSGACSKINYWFCTKKIPFGDGVRHFDGDMVSPKMFTWLHLINPVTTLGDCMVILGDTQCL